MYDDAGHLYGGAGFLSINTNNELYLHFNLYKDDGSSPIYENIKHIYITPFIYNIPASKC